MNSSVDLSNRGLRSEEDVREAFGGLSEEERSSAEYLFLDNNGLTSVPRDTLQLFPRLKWMDLRHNRICRLDNLELPPAGQHGDVAASVSLHTVLLQGNPAGSSRRRSLSRTLFRRIPSLRVCQTDDEQSEADCEKCDAGELRELKDHLPVAFLIPGRDYRAGQKSAP